MKNFLIFNKSQFIETKYSSKEEKSDFANWLVNFILNDFPLKSFSSKKYNRLSLCFGHIAHYDKEGFYSVWFSSKEKQKCFLQNIAKSLCYGSPEYTYSDVEKALKNWVISKNLHTGKQIEFTF